MKTTTRTNLIIAVVAGAIGYVADINGAVYDYVPMIALPLILSAVVIFWLNRTKPLAGLVGTLTGFALVYISFIGLTAVLDANSTFATSANWDTYGTGFVYVLLTTVVAIMLGLWVGREWQARFKLPKKAR